MILNNEMNIKMGYCNQPNELYGVVGVRNAHHCNEVISS